VDGLFRQDQFARLRDMQSVLLATVDDDDVTLAVE
jgi:hypothetical protein